MPASPRRSPDLRGGGSTGPAVTSAEAIFGSIGCTLVEGRPGPGSIGVRQPDGLMASFDCEGIAPQSVARAQQDYSASTTRSDRPVAMAGYYSWAYGGSEYVCTSGSSPSVTAEYYSPGWFLFRTSDGTVVGTEYHEAGTYTVSVSVQSCGWVDTFIGTWHGDTNGDEPPPPPGGGGGGDGGGDEPPPPPPPPADTCPVSQDSYNGILQNRFIQDSLNAVLQESRAIDTEIGGWILRNPTTGKLYFWRGQMVASQTDNCHVKTENEAGLPGEVIANWHTHPSRDGDVVICRISGDTGVTQNNLGGGGSVLDWDSADSTGLPVYTIDPDNIYRLDPGVAVEDRPSNQNQWQRIENGCALP